MKIKTFLLPIAALTALLARTPLDAQASQPIPTVHPGRLTIAYRTDDKPISFIAHGKPSGFLVAFEQAIGKQLGLPVEFVATDFASMLPSVKNHVYDSAAFPVLVTPPRRKIVDFTTPIGYAQARLVSRRTAPIIKIDGAEQKTIAVTQGSALIPLLQRIAPGVKVKQFPNIAASTNALLAGQVDGLFTGLATADHLVSQHHGLAGSQIVNSGEAAFPVAKSNPKLRAALNAAIARLMTNGTYTTLFQKWNPANVRIPSALYARYPGMKHERPAHH